MTDFPTKPGRVDEMYANTRRLREAEPARPTVNLPQPEVVDLMWLVGDWHLVVHEYATEHHAETIVETTRHITSELQGSWIQIEDAFGEEGTWARHITLDPLMHQWIVISMNTLGTANLARYPSSQGDSFTYEADITYLGVTYRQRVTTHYERPNRFTEEVEERLPDGTWRLAEIQTCTRS